MTKTSWLWFLRPEPAWPLAQCLTRTRLSANSNCGLGPFLSFPCPEGPLLY